MKVLRTGTTQNKNHYIVGQKFTCSACNCMFLLENGDLEHIEWSSVAKPKTIPCPECGSSVTLDGVYTLGSNGTINRAKYIADMKHLIAAEDHAKWDAELDLYLRAPKEGQS